MFVTSCTQSEQATLEVLNSLETALNDKDLETVLSLFAEDAIVQESYIPTATVYDTWIEIEVLWTNYLEVTQTSEFRNISIEGQTATFDWAEIGAIYTNIYPTIIEVQDGKIVYMDWFEESELVRTGEE
jgi:hypothetical protein